ncbi:MAG: hypothetical protein DWP97_10920 [Calditrichaeota bacterium]|nr:MAG: hypothetical protein DWP97_10920 [Calditrichota bacterium]
MISTILITGENIGVTVSLAVIFGGLAWLMYRSIKGREVDRRVIFLFIFVAVATPIIFTITFEFKATPIVRALYDKIESLPENSTVLLSYDFDPAMAPEVQPMANALTRHCLAKGHKIVYMCLFATGQGQLERTFREVIRPEFADKVDGIDYVNLGYKAGNEGVLNVIITDFQKMFPTDVNTVPYDSIPIFNNIKSCKDLDFIVSIGGGRPGIKEWILFVGDPGDIPIAAGVAAVVAPQLYPYYPNQLLGLLGGVKGAAEYENTLKDNYPRFENSDTPAIKMMGPQTLAHIVIMLFIIIGNILYFREKRLGKHK